MTLALMSWTFFWSHSVDRFEVAVPFEGHVNVHITPNILSYSSFGSEWAFMHPAMTAVSDMLEGQPHKGIQFPAAVCKDCTIEAPVSLTPP